MNTAILGSTLFSTRLNALSGVEPLSSLRRVKKKYPKYIILALTMVLFHSYFSFFLEDVMVTAEGSIRLHSIYLSRVWIEKTLNPHFGVSISITSWQVPYRGLHSSMCYENVCVYFFISSDSTESSTLYIVFCFSSVY